jgi:hypothetical protein
MKPMRSEALTSPALLSQRERRGKEARPSERMVRSAACRELLEHRGGDGGEEEAGGQGDRHADQEAAEVKPIAAIAGQSQRERRENGKKKAAQV